MLRNRARMGSSQQYPPGMVADYKALGPRLQPGLRSVAACRSCTVDEGKLIFSVVRSPTGCELCCLRMPVSRKLPSSSFPPTKAAHRRGHLTLLYWSADDRYGAANHTGVHTALVLVQYLSVPGTVSATTAPRSPALSLPGALLASPGPRSQSCTGSLAKSTHAPSRRVPRTESVCLALRGILHPPTPFLQSWAGTCSCVVARVLVCARASLPSEIGTGGTLFFFSSRYPHCVVEY